MRYLLLILLPTMALATGPKYNYEDPKLNDEFENVYRDITKGDDDTPESFTLAQLKTKTPERKGRFYFCSDCVTDGVCISTGTTIYGFARISARTTACQ